jgi:hypothetical protein
MIGFPNVIGGILIGIANDTWPARLLIPFAVLELCFAFIPQFLDVPASRSQTMRRIRHVDKFLSYVHYLVV